MALERKSSNFIAKPRPGRHTLSTSITLASFLREKLGVAASASEARKSIVSGKIEVNGKIRRDYRYPIGLGDIIKIVPSDESYIIGIGRYGTFDAKKVEKKDHKRTLKVVGKYIGSGKKQMIRLNNGNIFHYDKEVKVNDSVIVEERKIAKVIKLEHGAKCMVVSGAHAPAVGKIKEIVKGTATRDSTVRIEGENGTFETLLDNVMAIGA